MMRYVMLCFLLFPCFFTTASYAQLPGLRYGRLSNGLAYYIMQERDFAGEVNFYLYKNVGALVEEEGQQGMAHFLEHLAFNATEHFPQGVMSFLRSNQVVFNALTGINETSFQLYHVPVNEKKLADTLLWVVKDWCDGILFPKASIEKERNIILEEWRQDRTVEKRLSESVAPVVYNKSKYGYRNIIGNPSALKKYSAKDLKRFYDKWYRPELQYVAIVGDVDPEYWEKQVKRIFGAIAPSKKRTAREKLLVEDNEQPLYHRFVDKENVSNSFGIYQRRYLAPDTSQRGVAREGMMSRLFRELVARQLAMLRNEGKETYVAATMGYAPLIRFYAQNAWDVVPYKGKESEALEQILGIREKIRRQGFSEREFEEVKWSIYKDMKSLLEREHLGTPDNLMNLFKQHYLYGLPMQPFRKQLAASVEELVEIEADDLHQWIRSWMDHDENLAFITYSSSPEDMNISCEQFDACLAKASELPALTWEEPEKVDDLLDFGITAGNVVEEKEIRELEAEEWLLGNGAHVLYKYLPAVDDKVYFVGSAKGGSSVVPAKDLPSYSAMRSLIMQSGVYKYSRNQLYQWCQDHDIDLSLTITDDMVGLGGNTSPDNLESLFQYIHLVMMYQNFDKQVFEKFVERKKYLYSTRNLSGMNAVRDTINDLLYPPTIDNPKEDLAFYDNMRYEDLHRLYCEQFVNASAFTFCLIGNVPKAEAKHLVEKYIASLDDRSSLPRTFYARNKESECREIVREFDVDMEGDVGEVELAFVNHKELSPRQVFGLPLLKALIQDRMFEELREKAHGVYGVGVDVTYVSDADPTGTLKVHFSTERKKVDQMKKRAYEIIREISGNLFSDDDFKKVKIPFLLEEEENRLDAGPADGTAQAVADPIVWLGILNLYAEQGDGWNEANRKTGNEFLVEQITRTELAETLKHILDGAKKRDIVVKSVPLEKRHWER